jgi:hypothetical protein
MTSEGRRAKFLTGVTFSNWLKSHGEKDPQERWLRELYPWPILALIDYGRASVGLMQEISYDGVNYVATVLRAQWQEAHGTFRYQVHVDSDGLGWHARSFADDYDVCAGRDGSFVTLFHARKKEPLERVARAVFGDRWGDIKPEQLRTLSVSRFLAASLVTQLAVEAFSAANLEHYPRSRLVGGEPLLADDGRLWIGYRFFSEDAYTWARRNAGRADRVIAIYLADTKYQIRVDLPKGAEVESASALDGQFLDGRYERYVRALLRALEIDATLDAITATALITGQLQPPVEQMVASEADVHESLAALKRPCKTKSDLRYQLAAGVLLNSWIESERRTGYPQRKKFYAFNQRIDELSRWAMETKPSGVVLWAEPSPLPNERILFIRIDGVDFSFHAIPFASELHDVDAHPTWTGVRLKPIAPLVLSWARDLCSNHTR